MKINAKILTEAINHLATDTNIQEHGKIKNKMKGYVSSFGGSIVQSGIATACVAFLGDDNKKHIVEAIYSICKKVNSSVYTEAKLEDRKKISTADISSPTFRKDMAEAAVALKLAMRTYKFVDDKTETNEQ